MRGPKARRCEEGIGGSSFQDITQSALISAPCNLRARGAIIRYRRHGPLVQIDNGQTVAPVYPGFFEYVPQVYFHSADTEGPGCVRSPCLSCPAAPIPPRRVAPRSVADGPDAAHQPVRTHCRIVIEIGGLAHYTCRTGMEETPSFRRRESHPQTRTAAGDGKCGEVRSVAGTAWVPRALSIREGSVSLTAFIASISDLSAATTDGPPADAKGPRRPSIYRNRFCIANQFGIRGLTSGRRPNGGTLICSRWKGRIGLGPRSGSTHNFAATAPNSYSARSHQQSPSVF